MMDGVTLVADIGGTNARFALADLASGELHKHRSLSVENFPDIENAIGTYLAWCGERPEISCFAVACPVQNDEISLTNSSWHFNCAALAAHFGWRRFEAINDFNALALAIPQAGRNSFQQVRPGQGRDGSPIGILGPGTGLGVSALVPDGKGNWISLASEGGHVGFAPDGETEIELLRYLRARFDHVSVERIISGDGLCNIHDFLAKRAGKMHTLRHPADIASAALDAGDPLALEAINIFLGALGGLAGDLALTLGALGGLYIGGGIVRRLLSLLPESPFLARFTAKGRMDDLLQLVPIFVITDDRLALSGAAVHLTGKICAKAGS